MRRLNELVGDGVIEPEWAEYIKKTVVWQSQKTIIGRQLIAVGDPIGFEFEDFAFEVGTEMADAYVAFEVNTGAKMADEIDIAKSRVMLGAIQRPYRIPGKKLAASRKFGLPLDVHNVANATYKVNRLEDEMIIQGLSPDGGTTYDVAGYYQSAGQSYATTKDFDTAGNAIAAVAGGLALSNPYYTGAYNLGLNGTQWGQLAAKMISGVGREWNQVLTLLNPGISNPAAYKGMIYQSDKITVDTGLLTPIADPAIAELVIGVDYEALGDQRSVYSPLFGNVFVIAGPAVYQPNTVVTLASI